MAVTVIKYSDKALPKIKQHLIKGDPVVLPNPTPLPYMVVAVSPAIINMVKRRSADQAVASFIGGFESIKRYADLGDDGMELSERCLIKDRMTVLCPVRNDVEVPPFLVPAIKENYMLLFAAHLPDLQEMCCQLPPLYVSSGNLTAMKPEQLCSDVEAQFVRPGGPDINLLIVDGDHLRDQSQRHGSTTMVKISHTASISVVRDGIQRDNDS